ncbi:hypothetical protein BHE74_00051730 [Ensete ventricosum]|nr:hypothetical protein BHE74_00051730 [Ensete ventricosum]
MFACAVVNYFSSRTRLLPLPLFAPHLRSLPASFSVPRFGSLHLRLPGAAHGSATPPTKSQPSSPGPQKPRPSMASPGGNPNLFKLPSANPITGPSPFSQPSSYPSPPSSYPSPPPHGAFSYPPTTSPFHHHPFLLYPQDPLHRPAIAYAPAGAHPPNPNSALTTSPNPISNNNPGARLMALLNPPTSQFESAVSMPAPSTVPLELSPPANAVALRSTPFTLAVVQPVPARLPSCKLPRGRLLGGGHACAYDVDSRLLGESQPPQLEVTPITKYISDPGLVLGRQIAVNRTYICYGLKLGAIRVLNINTALRSLLKGHSQVDLASNF